MFDGCWICGATPAQQDHVKPLARGGIHALCNLRPICRQCNVHKSDKWPGAAGLRVLAEIVRNMDAAA